MNTVRIQRKALTEEVALFSPAGEIDAYTGAQLREVLAEAMDEGVRWLILDLGEVEYIDSVGLGIIVGTAKRAVERGGNLAVVGPQPNVLRVFEIAGAKELLNVVETLEQARERLRWPEGGAGEASRPAGEEP